MRDLNIYFLEVVLSIKLKEAVTMIVSYLLE